MHVLIYTIMVMVSGPGGQFSVATDSVEFSSFARCDEAAKSMDAVYSIKPVSVSPDGWHRGKSDPNAGGSVVAINWRCMPK